MQNQLTQIQNNDVIYIEGPCKMCGRVKTQGSKNSSLALIPTIIMAEGTSTLTNVPKLTDINHMLDFIRLLGIKVQYEDSKLKITVNNQRIKELPQNLECLSQVRTSYYYIPFLLKKYGSALLPKPGGCNLGDRKSDYLFDILRRFGADIFIKKSNILVKAKQLKGINYRLPYPSQSTTAIVLSLASIARGKSRIENISLNPEIDDKLAVLEKMGVELLRPDPRTIIIRGQDDFSEVKHRVMPDKVVAATWIGAAGITGGQIQLDKISEKFIKTELDIFEKLGLKRKRIDTNIIEYAFERPAKKVKICTGPYPEFNTDVQPITVALLAKFGAPESVVIESVFDKRFRYIKYLKKMGCIIEQYKTQDILCPNKKPANFVIIRSSVNGHFKAIDMSATDLRAGMALTICGLAAKGVSRVFRAHQIFRGYENVIDTLNALGAKVSYS